MKPELTYDQLLHKCSELEKELEFKKQHIDKLVNEHMQMREKLLSVAHYHHTMQKLKLFLDMIGAKTTNPIY